MLYKDARPDVDIFMPQLLKENPSAAESHRYLEQFEPGPPVDSCGQPGKELRLGRRRAIQLGI
jgi:hypothetical protein